MIRQARIAALVLLGACSQAASGAGADWEARRARLVAHLEKQGIRDPAVLAAMRRVPRHEFVPPDVRPSSYHDRALPIGAGQTISQPYIVALMTELAGVDKRSRVLEVGTGSGYQAAVLAEVAGEVYSIELEESLGKEAARTLGRLGYQRIQLRIGDGYRGWPDRQPFDAILITAAPPEVPRPLLEQLAPGGRLVAPVGEDGGEQELVVITRTATGFERRTVIPVRFVPMRGEAQKRR